MVEKIAFLRKYISGQQLETMADIAKDKIDEVYETIKNMPVTYETDGKSDEDIIVYLHYFINNMDFYIYENDVMMPPHQAFGVANINNAGFEKGYISIVELIENGVELDLYFEPTKLSEIIQKQ